MQDKSFIQDIHKEWEEKAKRLSKIISRYNISKKDSLTLIKMLGGDFFQYRGGDIKEAERLIQALEEEVKENG